MSVWPALAPVPTLSGREGSLVSVSIDVDPGRLEALLEALARVEFPINPQIYHEAEIVYRYADGHHDSVSVTLVEFPAYASRLSDVRNALEAYGFAPGSVHVTAMLDEIHAAGSDEPGPPGAPYLSRSLRKLAVRLNHQP